MRAKALMAICLLGVTLGVAGCNSTPDPANLALAAPGTSAPAPVAAPAPPSPPAPGVIGAAVGQALDEKDRTIAIAAQQEAVASGTRKSWRGAHGAYGFVTPGAENGSCRDYTHRVFINGRPQEAKGQACRQDGQWRVTS